MTLRPTRPRTRPGPAGIFPFPTQTSPETIRTAAGQPVPFAPKHRERADPERKRHPQRRFLFLSPAVGRHSIKI